MHFHDSGPTLESSVQLARGKIRVHLGAIHAHTKMTIAVGYIECRGVKTWKILWYFSNYILDIAFSRILVI